MSERTRLAAACLAGLAVLAAGVTLARRTLPEWRAGELPERAAVASRHAAVAAAAGLETGGQPAMALHGLDSDTLRTAYDAFGARTPDILAAAGVGVKLRVNGPARWSSGVAGGLSLAFSGAGELMQASWAPDDLSSMFAVPGDPGEAEAKAGRLGLLLLRPGETLGPVETRSILNTRLEYSPVEGSEPPAVVELTIPPSSNVAAARYVSSLPAALRMAEDKGFGRMLQLIAKPTLLVLALAVVFGVLLARRRIDLANAAVLAVLALVTAIPGELAGGATSLEKVISLGGLVVVVGLTLIVWATGESLVRSTLPGFTTSLDALRNLRLGPRAGRALSTGWAAGATLGGTLLAAWALAARVPALAPRKPSLDPPLLGLGSNPLISGVELAGLVLIAIAGAHRLVPRRWASPAAALFAGLLITPLPFDPVVGRILAGVLVAAALVWVFQRFGLASLLAAALAAKLLPAAVFASQYPAWLPLDIAVTAGLGLALPVLGMIGLGRPAAAEQGRLGVPAFIRRLERERRLQVEMEVLARLQLGLLPAELPVVPGYRFAAHTELASEAGGDLYDFLHDDGGHLWVAAGDVSGHGYPCAIAQAMVKAALVSHVAAERTPAEVLTRVDRVLRSGGVSRRFTSLSLVKLDLATGRGLVADAGHPYPVLFAGDGGRDLVLPGLPLGQGPARSYRDLEIVLPPGGGLLLYSDGLAESLDARGEAYGFDRPREVAAGAVPDAEAVVAAVLADWRRWTDGDRPADDTTLVAVCRSPAGADDA